MKEVRKLPKRTALKWLDLKRLQHPINTKEEGFIRDAIEGTNKSFTSGWLNDEVKK